MAKNRLKHPKRYAANGDKMITVGNQIIYTDASETNPGISKEIEFSTDYASESPSDNIYTKEREEYQNKPTENYETLRGENYEGISSFAKISNDVSFGEKPVFIEGEGSLKTVFGGRGQSRRRVGQDVTGSNKREKFSEKIGYHHGDLGKSEGRDNFPHSTGHFGTGTYFFGSEDLELGYNSRNGSTPVEKIHMDLYHLYRPDNYRDGKHWYCRFRKP